MEKVITVNRKARYDYAILEKYEAGIVLEGAEVKSLRAGGRVSLSDSFGDIERGEVYLHNLHIPSYEWSQSELEPRRNRKLLFHRQEIKKLAGKILERGLTLIPLRLYFKGAYVKLELGLARGKRQYDKRQSLKKKEAGREIQKAMKYKNSKR